MYNKRLSSSWLTLALHEGKHRFENSERFPEQQPWLFYSADNHHAMIQRRHVVFDVDTPAPDNVLLHPTFSANQKEGWWRHMVQKSHLPFWLLNFHFQSQIIYSGYFLNINTYVKLNYQIYYLTRIVCLAINFF